MKYAHVIISGFVQGVGYRHFVRSKARELGLKGWVKNLPADLGKPDGKVEAFFAGEEDKIKQMINFCRQGPFLSEVKNVDIEWEEKSLPTKLPEEFEIVID